MQIIVVNNKDTSPWILNRFLHKNIYIFNPAWLNQDEDWFSQNKKCNAWQKYDGQKPSGLYVFGKNSMYFATQINWVLSDPPLSLSGIFFENLMIFYKMNWNNVLYRKSWICIKWTEGDLNPRHPRCERGIATTRLPALLLSKMVSAFIHLLKE